VTNLRRHWPFWLILAAYLALAVTYSLNSPLYESTDELRHFRYVRHIAVYHALPVQRLDAPRAQSHHPPLYYTLGALLSGWIPVAQDVYYTPAENPFWGYRNWEVGDDNKNLYLHDDEERFPFHGVALAVYVVRWMTALIGAGVVWITYRIGREIFPERPEFAIGGAALVAFNPQFLYLSGAVNNDILAALCSAAVLWACVRLIHSGPSVRADVALGILFGLALLTKLNLLVLFLLIALAYLIATRPAADWRAFLRGLFIVLSLALLLSGWWFWRNQALYGDPTGMNQLNELWAGRPASENWWAVEQGLPYLWSSLWGRFGYGQIPMPKPVYQGILIACTLALAGYLLPRRKRLPRNAMLLLTVTLLTFLAVVLYYILIQPAGAMGRFLFPALPALALLLSVGLSRFFSSRMAWVTSAALSIGTAALAIYALVSILMPAFAPPTPLTESAAEAIPNTAEIEFGFSTDTEHNGVARLLGYQVMSSVVTPGDTLDVTVYWQPLTQTEQNYAVFVHLLSDVGVMVAQRDTYPGLGRYPTTAWVPGAVFADIYRVHVPQTAYAPDAGYVQVGLYLPGGPRLTTPDGGDALRLAVVEIQPRPGEVPNLVNANFGDQATLVGYTLDRRVARPGETIRLTLYWQARVPMEEKYRIFAHILGVENQVWANSDSKPSPSTRKWQPDQVIEDVHDLMVGMTTPPDIYDIEVGIYKPGPDGGRLPLIAEDSVRLGQRILLSKIRVVDDE
jgi:4-amino-4-deoxy-L-arabinose transferase-like glycosyltransferase